MYMESLFLALIVFLFIVINPYIDRLLEKLLNIQQKKSFKNAKASLLLIALWPYFNYSLLYLIALLICFVFMLKIDELQAMSLEKAKIKQIKYQFPIWLRQIQLLLQNNTVLVALELSSKNAPPLIQEDLNQLIQQIQEDAIHIQPYLSFLNQYHLLEVERAMKLLFRYNTVGKDGSEKQLNRMIQTTTKWLRNERKDHNNAKLTRYSFISLLPLVAVTFLFMVIMFEIITRLFQQGV